MTSRPVILDCDPGHDDALAIMLAAASTEIDLVAITTVSGNGAIDRVTENALRVCALAGITDVRIAKGAHHPLVGVAHSAPSIHGDSALDGAELPEPALTLDPLDAADLMADIIRQATEPVTIIATGPLTNLAHLLNRYPEIGDKIDQISLMGGSTDRGNWTPLAEFNIWADPEAAALVFDSGIPIAMVGLNVSHQILITPEVFARLEAQSTELSRTIIPLLKFFARTYDEVFSMPDPPLHDPVAVFAVTHPHHMKFVETNVAIEIEGPLTRGATVVDLHAVTGRPTNARVAVGIDVESFWNQMLDAIKLLGVRND